MRKIDWNKGWTFQREEKPEKAVTLPHDASQEVGRSENGISGTGGAFFNGGRYVYRKSFRKEDLVEAGAAEAFPATVILEIEGVYPMGEVLLNGQSLGWCNYGYRGYFFPLTDLQEDNVLEVRVDDTKRPNSRWYSGAGLYRPVNLHVAGGSYILPEGLKVKTLSIHPAVVEITAEAKLTGGTQKDGNVVLEISVLKDGQNVAAGQAENFKLTLEIPEAKLWSDETPELYTLEARLVGAAGETLDTATTTFGIRTIEWSPKGLCINGKETLLKGGCVHHDHGVVGAENLKEAEFRRAARMKEFGFNAIRSSHNPASKYLLEACDTLGLYVMDEGWDMWYQSKTPYDYATRFMDNWQEDAKALISKDFNHPSVIMYSIGNEVTEPAQEEGIKLAHTIADHFHALDNTRPLTAGLNLTLIAMQKMGINMTEMNDEAAKERSKDVNSTKFNEMAQQNAGQMMAAAARPEVDAMTADLFTALDIGGYNYASSRYELDGELHPDRVIVGSETYDWMLADNWALVEKLPYLIGDFMWTAWDYIGENGIGAWTWEPDGHSFFKGYPWLLGDTGALDILGHDNAEAGLAAVVWGAKPAYVAAVPVNHEGQELCKAMWRGTNALPHWSYQGCVGNHAQVEVYGNGQEAELILNGRVLGRKLFEKKKAVFEIPYEAGTLTARVLDESGNVLAKASLQSAVGEVSLRLQAEPKFTGDDIHYIAVDLVGENGEIECNADRKLTATVTGGELLGFGSANPKTAENFKDGCYTTYYGRALAVIRKTAQEATLTVSGEGLETKTLAI